jgi:hypothetical protein
MPGMNYDGSGTGNHLMPSSIIPTEVGSKNIGSIACIFQPHKVHDFLEPAFKFIQLLHIFIPNITGLIFPCFVELPVLRPSSLITMPS